MTSNPSTMVGLRRGRPPKISREKLVEAALGIGLDKLTLAEVARRLNVTIQSVYNHVRNRDELLFMTAVVLSERFPMPEDRGADWTVWMYDQAHALKRTYEHAPGFATVLMTRAPANAPTLGSRWETALQIAVRSGFEPVVALWVNMAVHEFTYAWVARQEQRHAQPEYLPPPHFSPEEDDSAHLDDMTHQAFRRSHDLPSGLRFDITLRALLDGLSKLRGRSIDEIREPGTNPAD